MIKEIDYFFNFFGTIIVANIYTFLTKIYTTGPVYIVFFLNRIFFFIFEENLFEIEPL